MCKAITKAKQNRVRIIKIFANLEYPKINKIIKTKNVKAPSILRNKINYFIAVVFDSFKTQTK